MENVLFLQIKLKIIKITWIVTYVVMFTMMLAVVDGQSSDPTRYDGYDLDHFNVPTDIPGGMTTIDLSFNQISNITDDSFDDINVDFSTVTDLYLEYNEIHTVTELAFQGFLSLNLLNLTANQLTHLDIKSELPNLQYLCVSENPGFIVNEAIMNSLMIKFPNLFDLELYEVKLTEIPKFKRDAPIDNELYLGLASNLIKNITREDIANCNASLYTSCFYDLDGNPINELPNILDFNLTEPINLEMDIYDVTFSCEDLCWMTENRYNVKGYYGDKMSISFGR